MAPCPAATRSGSTAIEYRTRQGTGNQRYNSLEAAVANYYLPFGHGQRFLHRNAVNVFHHLNAALPAANVSSPATVTQIASRMPATFSAVARREVNFQLRLEF